MLLINREDHSLKTDINNKIELLSGVNQIDDGVAIVGGPFLSWVEGDGAWDVMHVFVVFYDPSHLFLGSMLRQLVPNDGSTAEIDRFLNDEDILVLEPE